MQHTPDTDTLLNDYFRYIRWSGVPQGAGTTEARQNDEDKHRRRAVELACRYVELPYIDRGLSGFYGDNLEGALGRIKDDIASGTIRRNSVIAVEGHDRIGRLKLGEAALQYMGFLKAGIRLDINGKLRSWASINDGEQDGLFILMQDMMEMHAAHSYSAKLGKRVGEAYRIRREQLAAGERPRARSGAGSLVGHRCPAWLDPLPVAGPDGYLYRINELGEIVRMIFRWADSGVGCVIIARRLTEREIEPLANHHHRKVKKIVGWSSDSVLDLLHNKAVLGLYQPRKRDVRRDADGNELRGKIKVNQGEPLAYYPPLFPDDPGIFTRVQNSIRANNKAGKGRNGHGYANIVKGLAFCGCCGGKLSLPSRALSRHPTESGMPLKYLVCENARRKAVLQNGPLAGQACPNRHGFNYPKFENSLFELFAPTMIPVLAEMLPQYPGNEVAMRRLAQCEEAIASAEHRIARLVRLAADAGDDEIADGYATEAKRIGGQLTTQRREREELKAQLDIGRDQQQEIAEIVARLGGAADSETRYDLRTKLHQILCRYIRLTLHADTSITVRIDAHSGLNAIDARITLDGLDAIKVFGVADRPALELLEPIVGEAA